MPYTGSHYDNYTPASGTATYYWTVIEINSEKAYAAKLSNGKMTITQCQKRTGLPVRLCGYPSGWTSYDDLWSPSGNFDTDGISNVKASRATDQSIYTLQGVKVEGTPKPGIYIKNGRKFVVK